MIVLLPDIAMNIDLPFCLRYPYVEVFILSLLSLQCSCEGPAHQDHGEERANSGCVQEEVIMYIHGTVLTCFISAIYCDILIWHRIYVIHKI